MRRTGEMTSFERVMTALALDQPDRVPVVPISKVTSIRSASLTYRDCLRDPEGYVQSQVQGLKEYGFDAVHDISTAPLLAAMLGATIAIHDDDPPSVVEPLLKDHGDVDRLAPLASDPSKWLDYVRDVIRRLKKAVGPEVPVTCLVPSPFLLASTLRGIENLMFDFFDDPAFVESLCRLCVDYSTDYATLLMEAGADLVRLVNPVANASCISREHYRRFVHPCTRQMLAPLRARGVNVIFHTCGRWDDRLDLVTTEGANILHVDKMDLASFKRNYSDRVGLMGNVKTVETMLMGTPDDVERESRDCIQQAAAGGGYILSADCVLPRDTPPENIHAMVQAARKYGTYNT